MLERPFTARSTYLVQNMYLYGRRNLINFICTLVWFSSCTLGILFVTRIVNLPIKRSFERDQLTTLCCALTRLQFWGGGKA